MVSTTLTIERTTRDRLKKLGAKGESYDLIINKLIDLYSHENKGKKLIEVTA